MKIYHETDLTVFQMENKFKDGDVVYECGRPDQRMVITHFTNGLYYCQVQGNRKRKELVYLERDLRLAVKLMQHGQ
jgi:uncharacterized protein YodC (DUF2158 family)